MTADEIALAANHEAAHLAVLFALDIKPTSFIDNGRGWSTTYEPPINPVVLVAGMVGEVLNNQIIKYANVAENADAQQLEQLKFTKEEHTAAVREAQYLLELHRPYWKFLTQLLIASREKTQ